MALHLSSQVHCCEVACTLQRRSAKQAPTARGMRVATVCQAQGAPAPSRRSFAAGLVALPALLVAGRAAALIPDDDDERLVERAKANRKSRLANERRTESAFAKTSGLDTNADVLAVQRAVNALARSGAALDAGDVAAAAQAAREEGWVADFRRASQGLSASAAAKASVGKVLSGLDKLGAARGSLADAKQTFVTTVVALQAWAGDAGIAGSIKGL